MGLQVVRIPLPARLARLIAHERHLEVLSLLMFGRVSTLGCEPMGSVPHCHTDSCVAVAFCIA